jgi:hypothetical protein
MLKYYIVTLAALLITSICLSQKPKEITVGPGENPGEVFPIKDKYRFENFVAGYIVTPEGKRTKPMKLNFNLFSELPQFIDEKGDTLFVDGHIVKEIYIGNTKYVHNSSKEYYEILANSPSVNLAALKFWKINRVETSYEHPVGGGKTTGVSRTPGSQVYSEIHGRMIRDEYTVYRKDSMYYFINTKGKLFKANEDNLLKLFPDRKQQVIDCIKSNSIDLKNENDLKTLFEKCLK